MSDALKNCPVGFVGAQGLAPLVQFWCKYNGYRFNPIHWECIKGLLTPSKGRFSNFTTKPTLMQQIAKAVDKLGFGGMLYHVRLIAYKTIRFS